MSPPGRPAVLALVLLCSISLAAALGPEDLALRDRQQWQQTGALCSLSVAFVLCVFVVSLEIVRTGRRRSVLGATAIDFAVVLGLSFFVRFALTEPNILTDGGSGHGRLGRIVAPGMSGLPALLWLLFGDAPQPMWTLLRVPWTLSALAPPFLLVLARALDLSRSVSLLAGIALASFPLHAAMYSSDFELGALVSLELLGLALLAAGIRSERGALTWAGTALLGFVCWGRPDATIIAAPFAVLALPALWRGAQRGPLALAVVWLAVNAVASFLIGRSVGARPAGISIRWWSYFPALEFLRLSPIVPWWLWGPLPIGVLRLLNETRRNLLLVVTGVTTGLLPLSVSAVGADPTGSYMEYFRYGTWALPWIVLVTALGLDGVARFAGTRLNAADPLRARRLARVLQAAAIVLCAATPFLSRDYLGRRYGPRVEEEAFREALRHLPAGCVLVVPDDASEDQSGGTIEIERRYVYIAEEEMMGANQRTAPPPIVGVSAFLAAAGGQQDSLPSSGQSSGPTCWYWFRGSYCYTGLYGSGSPPCVELERRADLERIWSRRIVYISHRMVTRPDVRRPPFYDPAQELVLARIRALRGR